MMQSESLFVSESLEQQQRYNRVQTFLEDGDLEEALEETRLLLAQDGEDSDLWCLEGIVRLALGELQAAERSFDRACSLSPDEPMPLLHKARFLLTIHEYEEAVRHVETALQWVEHLEERVEALLLLAQAQLGRAEFLIEEWQTKLEEEEDELAAQIGYVPEEDSLPTLPLEIKALLEKGLTSVDEVLELDNKRPEGWLWHAFYMMGMNQPEQAVDSWNKAILLDPENPFFYHELGSLYTIMDEFEKAEEAFEHLYALEVAQHEQEGMEFASFDFEEIAQRACQDLQNNFIEDWGVSLPISMEVFEFPEHDLLEQAPSRQPFDPWTACHVEIQGNENSEMSLHFMLFQRNVERQLADDSNENLYESLFELLHQILVESISMMETEEVIEA